MPSREDGTARPGRRRPSLAVLILVAAALIVAASAPGGGARVAGAASNGDLPRKGYLGARLAPLPAEAAAREKLGAASGVVIEDVIPGTTAEESGLQAGDVLVAMDGKGVIGVVDVMSRVGALPAGRHFELTLLRDGRRMTLPVTLKERPRDKGANFDVLYEHVVSRGARIRTLVTRPQAPGRHPALVLVQGVGPATIDAPIAGPDPYSRILNDFAQRGWVTMRVERPGIGDSEGGPFADVDFETDLDAFRRALSSARAYSFVDPDDVFVFGHGLGGVFAPILAAETPVRGIAVYGTVAKTWTEYFLETWRRQSALAGDDPASIDTAQRNLAVVLHELLVRRRPLDEVFRTRPELRPILAKLAPGGKIVGRSVPFWAQLATRSLPAAWAKGNASVLAIWGTNDFVASREDHPFIAEIVNRARPGKGTFVALEGADHGFRKTASIEDAYRRGSAANVELNAEIVTTLREWMEKVRAGR